MLPNILKESRGEGDFMRELVENLRAVLARKSPQTDAGAMDELKAVVKEAIPMLQGTMLCQRVIKPGRYLCYKDPDFGFVIMCLVWGQGDATPIHDHGIWGVEAVLRNTLRVTSYTDCESDPKPVETAVCVAGAVISNAPGNRDVHKVEHFAGDYAVSLHVYGKEMTGNRMFVPGEGFKCCKLETHSLEREFGFAANINAPSAV